MKINIEIGLINNQIIFDFSGSSDESFKMTRLIKRVLAERHEYSKLQINLHKLKRSDNSGIKYKEFIYLVKKEFPQSFDIALSELSDEKLKIFKKMINLIKEYENEKIELQNNFTLVMESPLYELNTKMFSDSFKPYNFQETQSKRMFASKRICNFSSPGSGKTIVSFMAVLSEYAENNINIVLVAGPKSASNA
ncbi:MAG: hypothetical protein DSZ21_01075 [Tenericutes bacterium]|nr:MAG: hypothetical protein DSZ21_01075 [Mycoplasmatota bacterium]